ncbi:MAG: hypothetical protein Q9187_000961 [Circinaria calcarea]
MEVMTEVVITLTPLDGTSKRTLILNPAKRHVEIGRASKTASKGLVARKDNAWFDSPIMSRTHAEILLVLDPERAIFLQDLGSTHGTFAETRRLDTGERYPFVNGDVITFGQKVTSGACTYPAKEFHVHYIWQPWSPQSDPSPESWSTNVNPGFQVPSEESESDEEFPRKTRSDMSILVSAMNTSSGSPMNNSGFDIDEAITPSSSTSHVALDKPPSGKVVPEISKSSKITSDLADQPVVVSEVTKSDVQVFDLTGTEEDRPHKSISEDACLGSTQANPIELEPTDPKVHYDTVSDTDDEGPESLPIGQNPITQSAQNSATQVKSAATRSTNFHRFMIDSSDGSEASDDEINGKRIRKAAVESTIADSDTNETDPEDDLFVSEGEDYDFDLQQELIADHGRTSHDSHPLSWDDSDIDEEVEDDDEDLVDLDESGPDQKAVQGTCVHLNIKEDIALDRHRVLVENSQMIMPSLRISAAEAIDVSQNCMSPWVPLHRAPSPSDAALVKPPKMTKLPHEATMDKSFSRSFTEEHLSTRHLSSDMNGYPPKLTDVTSNHVTANPSLFVPDYNFNYNDQILPRYDDGPFAGWQKYSVPSLHQHQFMPSSRPANIESQQNDLNASEGPYTQPYWRYNMEQRDAVDAGAPPAMTAPDIYTEHQNTHKLSETREIKSSRLPISDIVNEASVQIKDLSHGLKRKVDEMMRDDQVEERNAEMTSASSHRFTQESILPNAQSRDVVEFSEPMRQETLLEPVTLAVDSMAVASTEGPIRKKLKHDVRRPSGIRTFVSGMVAGGLSVMGALFMYGVTAPEVIQDTVRLEFQRHV